MGRSSCIIERDDNVDEDPTSVGVVHIVDDDSELRAALIRLVRSSGLNAVGHSTSSELRNALSVNVPSCIILDMRLEHENGLTIQEALQQEGTTAPVIFLTGFGTIPMTVQAMRRGAAEFLTKPVDDIVLMSAIERALQFDAATALKRRSHTDLSQRLASLTDREREVMALTIGGLMNKQIAGELGTTEITAKVHKRRVMDKMGARSLPDLVRMAETLGIRALRSR
jgi:FixJ family two-component response regulator